MALLLPSLFGRLPQMTVAAVVDLFVLAFVIYHILLIIKGTRATQILVGVALLAVVYYGARWAELRTVEWVLGNVFSYLVFAIIVLFQAEIRRGLAKIGRNPFSTRFSSFQARQAFEDILMAINLFASQKIGALLVIERETGLRTYTESGIPLHAQLSYDLLAAIFQPRAPLHDGATIIREDKIVAASCFLPLSVNPIWGTQLGTRHRAAIGVTEETGAREVAPSRRAAWPGRGAIATIVRALSPIGSLSTYLPIAGS